jgi:hypothetical protein
LANHISPLAQVFRGMADLIDHDHTSQTQYEAVTKAAEALAARAFHAGLPRQAATATHIQALVETSPAPTHGGDKAPRGDPTPIMAGNSAGRTAQPAPLPGPRATPVDPRRLPDLPFTTWTQPMRPSSGRPSPSFGVARSSRAASSSG